MPGAQDMLPNRRLKLAGAPAGHSSERLVLSTKVIDQTARLVHFRAGSLSADPLDSRQY
jgi:hypothetical protein